MASVERHPTFEHRHRNIHGGLARAAIFGVSDGLTTNISLVLGVAAANTGPGFVRLAGLAGLLAGSFSMAAGEYVSMRAQAELFGRELKVEAAAIKADPDTEQRELALIYRARGLRPALADKVAAQLMRDPDQALESHARDELGIRPDQLGSPFGAAGWSLGAFGVGAAVPLLPWYFTQGTAAVLASVSLGAVAALAVGASVGIATARSPVRSALRQLAITALAAGVVFLVGRIVGVAT
jgi:vacuolar iron transporter family protein